MVEKINFKKYSRKNKVTLEGRGDPPLKRLGKQQNKKKTAKTNNNYIQNSMSILIKKQLIKPMKPQIRHQPNKRNFMALKKIRDLLLMKLGVNLKK